MPTIRNNTPRVINLGINDGSIEKLVPERESIPIHLPLFYTWGQRGPELPVLTGPNGDYGRIFGSESLNERSPYYTHATKMIETILARGNSCLIKKLVPVDAQVAGLTLVATLIRKAPVATITGTWNPTTAIPVGAANNSYRIAGLTVPSYSVLGETVHNGDIVTFNVDGDDIDTVVTPSGMFYKQARTGAGVLQVDSTGNPLYEFVGTPATPTTTWNVHGSVVSGNWVISSPGTPVASQVNGIFTITGLAAGQQVIVAGKLVKNGDIVTFDAGTDSITDVYYSGAPQTKTTLTANGQTPEFVVESAIIKWDWVEADYDVDGNLSDAHTKISAMQQVEDTGDIQIITIPTVTLLFPSHGDCGNNTSVSLWVDTRYSSEVVENNKALTLKAMFKERAAAGKPAYPVTTLNNATMVDFTFNPKAYNEFTKEDLYIDNIVTYYNDDGIAAGTSPTLGPVGTVIVHDLFGESAGNWDTTVDAFPALVAELTAADTAGVTTCIDFIYDYLADVEAIARSADGAAVDVFDATTDQRLLNIFSGQSAQAYLNGVDYYGFQIGLLNSGTLNNEAFPEYSTDFSNNVVFSTSGIYWMGGGVDGEMTDATFEDRVQYEINSNFDNPEYSLLDTGHYPFSCVYDSGFTMDTKEVLLKWLGYRKDVHVTVGTHAAGEKLDLQAEENRAAALLQAAQAYAESEEFGTACVRCVIIAQSGQLIKGSYRTRLPLTHELAYKRAGYFGASNGIVKYGFDYTVAPLKNLALFNPGTVNNVFMDEDARELLWTSGANYVRFNDRSTLHHEALQTVYDPRNSILTSEKLMQVAVDVEKQLDKVWKKNSGDTELTPNQFLERCNDDLIAFTAGKYGAGIVIEANSFYTPSDTARGYSWNMEAVVKGNVQKTTATVSVTAQRNFD